MRIITLLGGQVYRINQNLKGQRLCVAQHVRPLTNSFELQEEKKSSSQGRVLYDLELPPYGLVCLQVKRVSHRLTLPTPELIKGGREEIGSSDQGRIKLLLWLMPILNFQDPPHTDQTAPTSPTLCLLVRSNRYFLLFHCSSVVDSSLLKMSTFRSKSLSKGHSYNSHSKI